jgi:hypothetical protein
LRIVRANPLCIVERRLPYDPNVKVAADGYVIEPVSSPFVLTKINELIGLDAVLPARER